jgi:signal transduction histidine kinase
MNNDNQPLLTMKNIHVAYGSIRALNGVDFDLLPGEIHAITGEHRAGKSSLVKLLSGAVRKKSGEIRLYGKEVDYLSPVNSAKSGIGMIYQDPHFIETLSARDNMFTGQCRTGGLGFLKKKWMQNQTVEIFRRLKLDFDPDLPLSSLTSAQQNMVEFARILVQEPKIIIFDEIATKLNPGEMKTVYRLIRDFREQGVGIIYISHDMDEILRLADRVTILREGYRRGTENIRDLDKFRLFELTYSYVLDGDEIKRDKSRFLLMRSYLENLLHHLPIGAVLLDEALDPVIINYAALSLLNKEEENPDDLTSLLNQLPDEQTGQLIRNISTGRECTIPEVPAGENKIIELRSFPFNEPTFAFAGTVILVRDMSINQYMSDYIIQTEKMASVAEVAVGVAHEINNPLFIIQNYLEIIKEDIDGYSQEFGKIEKELSRIMEIIGSLLSFSHTNPVGSGSINLNELMDEVLLLLNHRFREKRINVNSHLADYPIIVPGNENRIKQLLMNLYGNSIEAVLNNGDITTGLEILENYAVITIKDNGNGIPQDIRERIFKPFYSTKVNKRNTGLGLSICQQIVEEHGGEIDFDSVPGKETLFRVSLPLQSVPL